MGYLFKPVVADVPAISCAINWPKEGNNWVILVPRCWIAVGSEIDKLMVRGFGNDWPLTDKERGELYPSWYAGERILVYGVLIDP